MMQTPLIKRNYKAVLSRFNAFNCSLHGGLSGLLFLFCKTDQNKQRRLKIMTHI